jgi:HD-GYP domain-containing protein (c-di-GMP phosphodiesterase class II)
VVRHRSKARYVDHSPRVIGTALLLVIVCLATLAVLGPIAGVPTIDAEVILLSIILIVLIICADFFEIDAPLSSVRITVSVSAALCFAAAITLGPVIGALVAGVSALATEIIEGRDLVKALVNISNYVLASFMGGFAYVSLADTSVSPINTLENAAATILAAALYTVVNAGSIALVISQVVHHSPIDILRANFRSGLFEHLSLPTMGIMIPVLKEESLFALIIVIIPLLGPYLAFRSYHQVHEETRATLEVLADMLDRRDPYTAEHSQRVSSLVERMLDYYPQVSFEERETILTAARIHDLGKVTTRDATLMKPGKLNDEEFEEIRRHSAEGAKVLSHISVFQDAARIIRHHNERWDGKGYPDRLSGEDIPIGSRLIAVADTYDAMTTDRPYREALSHEVALTEIRRQAGHQFEPTAAEAFLQLMSKQPVIGDTKVFHEAQSGD